MKFKIKKGIEEEHSGAFALKKVHFIAGILGLVTLIVLGFLIIRNPNSESDYTGSVSIKQDACKLFSLADAKKVLGSSTEASVNNANAVSSKATVSTCSYSSGSKKIDDLIALTVLVRSSNKTQARQAFELAKSPTSDDIKGYGDQAYYNPDTSQLNILKDDTWIIIASTKGTSGKGTVGIPKNVAKVIVGRL